MDQHTQTTATNLPENPSPDRGDPGDAFTTLLMLGLACWSIIVVVLF